MIGGASVSVATIGLRTARHTHRVKIPPQPQRCMRPVTATGHTDDPPVLQTFFSFEAVLSASIGGYCADLMDEVGTSGYK
jgi:hypothetical protein